MAYFWYNSELSKQITKLEPNSANQKHVRFNNFFVTTVDYLVLPTISGSSSGKPPFSPNKLALTTLQTGIGESSYCQQNKYSWRLSWKPINTINKIKNQHPLIKIFFYTWLWRGSTNVTFRVSICRSHKPHGLMGEAGDSHTCMGICPGKYNIGNEIFLF